jgi:hypothetical protein
MSIQGAHRRCFGAVLAGLCLLGASPIHAAEPKAVGWLEAVVFPDSQLRVTAKLDTGAKSSAIDAENVQRFERGGEPWVRFGLRRKKGRGEAHVFEARVVGDKKIRSAVGKDVRPLVDLWLCVAGEKRRVLFSLSSRGAMNYRVILGRRALEGRLLVDSGRKFTSEPGCSVTE